MAADLGISDQAVYIWQRQHVIDTGWLPGSTTAENAELVAARQRIAEVETEMRDSPPGQRTAREGDAPIGRFDAIRVMATSRLPVQAATRSWASRSRATTSRGLTALGPGHAP